MMGVSNEMVDFAVTLERHLGANWAPVNLEYQLRANAEVKYNRSTFEKYVDGEWVKVADQYS